VVALAAMDVLATLGPQGSYPVGGHRVRVSLPGSPSSEGGSAWQRYW
jgi:hypothetical protein